MDTRLSHSADTSDQLTRFVFDHMPVRGLHVRLDEVWRHIGRHKTYPQAVRHALGELLAATVLLASNLKFSGSLIAQIQGKGALKMLVAEATSEHTCRATARWDENAEWADGAPLGELLGGDAVFVLTLQPAQGEPWQGIVSTEGGSIAEMLMAYMAQSEQLDTFIALAADDAHAGGLLLQRLPENDIRENDWTEAVALAETLKPEELCGLDAPTLLYRLFHETPPRVFAPQALEFACTCSRGKVSDMLLLLGAQEVGSAVAEQGSIEIDCDFCHARYVFDETDVNALFGSDIVQAAKSGTDAENHNLPH